MKTLFSIMLVLTLGTNVANATHWMTNFKKAKKYAIATNRLVLVDFWATWCGPCKKMDADTWSKTEVKELMKSYVPVKIDIDINKAIARKYNVNAIPSVLIVDGNGEIVYQSKGYMSKQQVMSLLKKFELNTSFLANEMTQYNLKKNFASTLRLGSKYQEFSLHLDKSIKATFVKLSNNYLKEAKNLLKKEKSLDKVALNQRLDLLDIQGKLILNKIKKGAKLLNQIKKSDLEKLNHSLYDFLKYVCYIKNKDEKNAQELKSLISSRDLKRAALF